MDHDILPDVNAHQSALPAIPERTPLRVYAEQLDAAGYHRVTAIRGDREFRDQFYLEEENGADDFAANAAQTLAEPGEDAAALVQEIADMVAKKRGEFWRREEPGPRRAAFRVALQRGGMALAGADRAGQTHDAGG